MAAAWEFSVLDFFISIRNDALTAFNKFITMLGDKGIFWIILCAVLLIIPKTRKIGLYAAVALAVQALLGELALKHIVQRERPFVQDPSITTIIPLPMGKYSLPSGHSASSAAVAVSVFLQNKKFGIPLIALSLLIMQSRLYFCVHFLTDILAGAALGTAVAIMVYYTMNYIIKKRRERAPE
ncbi:MAG: phosphatase PAP2 family protein [Ruminococcus sp.]|nr:phosphatase PAP2 family protein [Ruminococcus sp.]